METYQAPERAPVQIKEASTADIPTLIEIEKSIGDTHTYSSMLTFDEWQEEMQKNRVYLIEKNGIAIGNFSYEMKSDDHVYISGLIVSPQYQGQGIARYVLTHLLDELKDIKKIDLVTHPDNRVALELYQSLGFVVESRMENYFGDGEPRLVLVKQNTDP